MDLTQKLNTPLGDHPLPGGAVPPAAAVGGAGKAGRGGGHGQRLPRASPFGEDGGRGSGGRGRGGGGGGGGGGGRGGSRGRSGGAFYRGRGSGDTTPQPIVSKYGQLSVQDIANAPREERVLKVSCKSEVKAVAGSIAYVCRAGEAPILYATGYDPCNQAIKAVCVAGRYLLADSLELRVTPVFQGDTASVHLRLEKRTRAAVMADPESVVSLIVLKTSNPFKSAGAIASRIRAGERVQVMSNGHGVFRALEAIAVARTYLEEDAKDISFEASMVNITTTGPRCVFSARR
jgi:stage V sporulation protein SpoVS